MSAPTEFRAHLAELLHGDRAQQRWGRSLEDVAAALDDAELLLNSRGDTTDTADVVRVARLLLDREAELARREVEARLDEEH